MNDSKMRIISEIECPHCKKGIYVGHNIVAEQEGVWSPELISAAKETVRESILKLKFVNPDDMTTVLQWLDSEGTVFGPADVDAVLAEITSSNAIHNDNPSEDTIK